MEKMEMWLKEQFAKGELSKLEKISIATGAMKHDETSKEEALEIIFKIVQGEL